MENSHDQDSKLSKSLSSIREWMKTLEVNREADIKKHTMSTSSRKCLENLYQEYFEHENEDHNKQSIGKGISAKKGGFIFSEYLRALSNDGKNTPTTGYNHECCQILRLLCWNYTDASLELCVDFGKNGGFVILVADLKKFKNDIGDENISSNIILPSMAILHNCAKAPDNRKYLKQAKALDAIVPYVRVDDSEIRMRAMMSIAYIIDEDMDNHIISVDGTLIKYILEYLNAAISSEGHKHNGFSALEIVDGLLHLASNDSNKVIIVNEGILPLLVALMENGNESEKALSAETVWVLSFMEENAKKIRSDANIRRALTGLLKYHGAAKIKASGAIWKLENEPKNVVRNESGAEQHIMISYQWGHQNLAMQIKKKLKEQNFRVWMDVDQMSGSTLEAMGKAVENSEVILVFISEKYKESPNARTEAEYAYKLQKIIVPLMVEPNYQPKGWLGALLGTKLYFDFSNETAFDDVFENLLKELGRKLKTGGPIMETS